MNEDSAWIYWIIFIAGAIVVVKLFGFELFPSNITVYAAICQEKVVSNHCDKHKSGGIFTSETFKPSFSTQQVFYLDAPNGWQKYTDCVVKDRENWTCWGSSKKKSKFGFIDGKYWTKIDPSEFNLYYQGTSSNQTEKIYFLSRPEWILRWCESGTSYDFVCLAKEIFANEYSENNIIPQ